MYLDDALVKVNQFEAPVPWMYLDTVGMVTVVAGFALRDVSDAAALNFQVQGVRSTPNQIAADFTRVKTMKPGMIAAAYRQAGCPELDAETIQAGLRSRLAGVDAALRAQLSGYAEAPDAAKLALLDMAYNLGVHGLIFGYPRLRSAVMSGDWKAAAEQCHRDGPGAERNDWTRAQFLAAA